MAKGKRSKPSNFVLRIRALPADCIKLGETADGTTLWTEGDGTGNIFAVRTEQVVYRVLGPAFGTVPALDASHAHRRRKDA